MAKGNPFGNIPGLQGMMKQVQKMVEDQQKLEDELRETRMEASSGGGMVKAVANGAGEILEVKIDPKVVDPEDVEMLEDLVVSAVREVVDSANALKESKMKELTGGLNLPGMPGMPQMPF